VDPKTRDPYRLDSKFGEYTWATPGLTNTIQDTVTSDKKSTPTIKNEPLKEIETIYKDRWHKPDYNIGDISLGLSLPNVYDIDPRYLDVQPQLNRISRGQRAFQNNLGSRTSSDMSNLLQSQINAYNQDQEVFGQKYNYDRQQDAQTQQFNAQAKMSTDRANQA